VSGNAFWTFSDGHKDYLTDEEAKAYMDKTGAYRLRYHKTYEELHPIKPLRRFKSDAWSPGWQPALGMHCESKSDYDREIKKRGLIEMGNEPPTQHKPAPAKPYVTDEVVNMARDMGASFSDGEVREAMDTLN
jgi:hypothetical protein